MYGNRPNYKLMQQKHAVCCRYQNSCNWHKRLRGHDRTQGQARSGDPGQGGAVSVGPIWNACIAICPAKHQTDNAFYIVYIEKLIQSVIKKKRCCELGP